MAKNKEQRKSLLAITFLLAAIVLFTLILILAVIYLVIVKTTFISLLYSDKVNKVGILILLITISLVIGYALTFVLGRLLLKPVRKILDCMEALASGKYESRINFSGPFAKYDMFLDLSNSFNKMAYELQHTEMVSNEFINNFSHELKTPIMSIAGFVKLLRRGNLTLEQQDEYLKIIEDESLRLSKMATGILDIMKVENQAILTNVTTFNLSEQIRTCMLLLENKWTDRNIDIQLDFDEFNISANQELLKEVWLNLIDNAIKYTPDGGIIKIEIKEKNDDTIITVGNTGSEIKPDNQKRIFNKFYQADESHASSGYGIGLAVVKKIITLHNGNICVLSGNNKTVFIVTLPTKQ
ncbi:MAG: HAMP domain-containing histidine kinase [Treponema sp.]|nr:HAMP domain-containing histidine kinase [Treponema sp.]